MSLIRSASLLGFADLVNSLGGDPEAIVDSLGIPRAALLDHELPISLPAVARAYEVASASCHCDDFGLRASAYQDLSGLGPIAIAVSNSPTLGDALKTIQRFMRLHSPDAIVELAPDPYGSEGTVGLRHYWRVDLVGCVQMHDRALLNLHRAVETLAGDDYGLRSVEIGYRPTAPLVRYEQAFSGRDRVRVNPSRPASMLRIPRALLHRPIAGANETLHHLASHYLVEQRAPDGFVTTTRTRAALQALLGSGTTSLPAVAHTLALPVRTLQHRLRQEGRTFGEVLDEVRRDQALQLLARRDLTISEVASMLDLGSQATLSRAARRWWAVTPTAKRQELSQPI